MTKKTHTCDTCGKCYSRHEHLQRHAASHENVKPWHCQFCSKHFARRDVLNRHFKSCVPDARGARAQGGRVNRACQNCKERKVKCSGGRPCDLCVKYPVPCIYTLHGVSPYMRRQPSSTSDTQVSELYDSSQSPPSRPYLPRLSSIGQKSFAENEDIRPFRDEYDMCPRKITATSGQKNRPSLNSLIAPKPSPSTRSTDQPLSPRERGSSGTGSCLFDWFFVGNEHKPSASSALSQKRTSISESLSSPGLSGTITSALDNPSARNATPAMAVELQRAGVDLARINPLENHRSKILLFLQTVDEVQPRHTQWLDLQSMEQLLTTYFLRHDQHTPIIHLPQWSVATCETSLIFAIMLVSLTSLSDTWAGIADIGILLRAAFGFVQSPVDRNGSHPTSLETLQALVLLVIVDKLMLNGGQTHSKIDLAHIISLAREARFLEEEAGSNKGGTLGTEWQEWARQESRRRTVFVLYSFDALISCLEDERPHIAAAEMSLCMPSPESLFLAETAEAWVQARETTGSVNRLPYSVVLSMLLSDFSLNVELPPTLLGGFAVLHGIMAYMRETRQSYYHGLGHEMVCAFTKKRYEAIQSALQVWCKSWLSMLKNPLCGTASAHGIYKDRALVYWYLTGVLTLPDSIVASSCTGQTVEDRGPTFKVLLERLITVYDKGQLTACAGEFEAARQLVVRPSSPDTRRIPIGSLLYKEPDAGACAFG